MTTSKENTNLVNSTSNNRMDNPSPKKVVVVGGGVAGLSAGIYAQKSGFDTTILEAHSIAGGNCTSWRRRDYTFEGGMHWLGGSNSDEALNKVWRYMGGINDKVKISYKEPFVEFDHKGTAIRLYRDLARTQAHLLELSPEDATEIKAFCKNIRKVQNLAMPVMDIKGVDTTQKAQPSLGLLWAVMQVLMVNRKFAKISRAKYANRFKHEGIRELMLSIPGAEQGMTNLFMTMGTLARGDGGFPEGGSLPFIARITDTFEAAGGKLVLKSPATRVITEKGKVTGVEAAGVHYPADAVIVASDTMAAEKLFDAPIEAKWLDEMKKNTEPTMVVLVSLGINADLSTYADRPVIQMKKRLTIDTVDFDFIMPSNYASDRDYSPEGKTAMTIQLPGDTFDYWKKLKAEGGYKEEKQRVAQAIIAEIEASMPEAAGKVEVIDVATPVTYERYCGNWKGSWMTAITGSFDNKEYPATVDNVEGLYFAGQRMMPPGGLPPAALTGRAAVQYLCRDTSTKFVSEQSEI